MAAIIRVAGRRVNNTKGVCGSSFAKILRLAAAKIAFSGDEQSRPALLFDGGENLLLIFDDGIEGALILQNGALILFYGFLIALNLLLIGKNLFLIRDDLLLIRNDVPLGHYFQASRP
jgi:hypothetical protein